MCDCVFFACVREYVCVCVSVFCSIFSTRDSKTVPEVQEKSEEIRSVSKTWRQTGHASHDWS